MDNCSKLLSKIGEYDMKTKSLGKAYIFNNEVFDDQNVGQRTGSGKDETDLTDLFNTMGFETKPFRNLTCSGLIEKLREIAKLNFSTDACFLAVFLSHGDKDSIRMRDTEVQEEKIFKELFQGPAQQALMGKPKIFIFQACRGKEFDEGNKKTFYDKSEKSPEVGKHSHDAEREEPNVWVSCIPAGADFIKCYPTPHGYVAFRYDEGQGSRFIQNLVKVLREYVTDQTDTRIDFTTLLKVVGNEVGSEKITYKEGNRRIEYKQMPCTVTTLTKKLYFPKMKEARKNAP